MSTNKILLKFAKKGINLSPEAYNRVINAENPIDFASSLIVKLKSDKFSSKDLISVSGETVDELTGIKPVQENNSQETLTNSQKEEKSKPIEQKPKTTPKPIKKEPEIKQTPEAKPIEKEPEIKQTPQEHEVDSIENLKKDSDIKEKHVNEVILEASETVKDEKIKFKRNLEKSNVRY